MWLPKHVVPYMGVPMRLGDFYSDRWCHPRYLPAYIYSELSQHCIDAAAICVSAVVG